MTSTLAPSPAGTSPVTAHDAARWVRQLTARIDVALELGLGAAPQGVALAWRSTVHDHPGLRALLTDPPAGADRAVVEALRRSMLATVALAAGLTSFQTPAPAAAAAGAAFLAEVEAGTAEEHRPSLVARVLRRIWDGGPADPWPWAA